MLCEFIAAEPSRIVHLGQSREREASLLRSKTPLCPLPAASGRGVTSPRRRPISSACKKCLQCSGAGFPQPEVITDMCQHPTPARPPRPCCRPSLSPGLWDLASPELDLRRFDLMASETEMQEL